MFPSRYPIFPPAFTTTAFLGWFTYYSSAYRWGMWQAKCVPDNSSYSAYPATVYAWYWPQKIVMILNTIEPQHHNMISTIFWHFYCYWWVFANLECKFISISGLVILLTTLSAIIILTVVPCQVKFEATNSQGGTGIYCQLLMHYWTNFLFTR